MSGAEQQILRRLTELTEKVDAVGLLVTDRAVPLDWALSADAGDPYQQWVGWDPERAAAMEAWTEKELGEGHYLAAVRLVTPLCGYLLIVTPDGRQAWQARDFHAAWPLPLAVVE